MTQMIRTRKYRARFYRNEQDVFSKLSGSKVLIYWPHGVGDWVFLSYLLPLFEPTNRYWITRFGDDTVSLMEGNEWATPLYTGIKSPHCHDGGQFGIRHFGVDLAEADGTEKNFVLPVPLFDACARIGIDSVLQTDFPEVHGCVPYPFHTKARNTLRVLAPQESLAHAYLDRPLRTTLNFDVGGFYARWVEAVLKVHLGLGERRLCLIGRNGYSSVGKNWGHLWREDLPEGKQREGEECRDFMRLMLKKDPNWSFLVLEDVLHEGFDTMRNKELNCFSYAEVFGEVGQGTSPFGLTMNALIHYSDLMVGVPIGPFHLAMTNPNLPTVGIWIEHHPSWYDEPKPNSMHVLSRNVTDAGLDRRPGSFVATEKLVIRTLQSAERIISGEQVLQAVEELL